MPSSAAIAAIARLGIGEEQNSSTRARGMSLARYRAAAAAVNRRTLSFYVTLPNYRNYWKEAGYVEEMEAIEKALAEGKRDCLPELMSDAWLSDCTLFGSPDEVRDGVEAWLEAGVETPILVPSSAVGNQATAFEELFAIYA